MLRLKRAPRIEASINAGKATRRLSVVGILTNTATVLRVKTVVKFLNIVL